MAIFVYINHWLSYTKDYPQCRFSRDPVVCVELIKLKQQELINKYGDRNDVDTRRRD